MKKFKITLVALIGIIVLFYIFFLFVLPNILNTNIIKNYLNKLAKDNTGVELNIDRIKVLTAFPLKVGVELDDVNIICNNKQNINLHSISSKVNLFPVLLKKISVNNIDVDGLDLSSDISSTGELSIMQCFVFPEKNEDDTAKPANNQNNDFVLDDNLPDINLKNINLSLYDKDSKNKLSLNIDNFNADKIVLNKHFRAYTNGSVLLNQKENINFDIKADSFLPEFTQNSNDKSEAIRYFNFIKEFAKYNLKSTLKADLKIANKKNKIFIDGFAYIDNLSLNIADEKLPDSHMHILFNKHNADIDSEINIMNGEKLNLISHINNSKNWNLDINLETEKISFENLRKIALEVLSTFNIENDLKHRKAKGYIVADVDVKLNPKKLNSKGYLKIINGQVVSDNSNFHIKDFNSHIDCENNTINIKDTSLKVNDALIIAKGLIDEKANANLEIATKKLSVAKLFDAFAFGDLKNNYNINNGLLDLTINAKGQLKTIKPSINLVLASLNIYDKVNKITLSNEKIIADVITDGKEFSGNIILNTTKAGLSNFRTNIKLPMLKINISKDKIDIPSSQILVNSSQLNFVGSIKDYLSKPDILFNITGNIVANDIKNFVPDSMKQFVKASGRLPVKLTLNGSGAINLQAQIFADSNNNIDFIKIAQLNNKKSIFNMNVSMNNNNLDIKDIGIYTTARSTFENNLESNITNANEIVKLTGSIMNFNTLNNVKLDFSETLGINMMNISAKTTGNLTASGNINNPKIRGNLSISALNAPDYLIKNQTTNINITPSIITAQIYGLNLGGDVMDADIVMKNDFTVPYQITKANVHSHTFDLDKILLVTSKFASSSSNSSAASNALIMPVKVYQGKWKVDKCKLATIEASDLNTDFTIYNDIFDFKNLTSTAYKGDLNGDIKYDLKRLLMTAKLNGNNMDANPAIVALLGIKDQIMGTLKFDADVSMQGATLNEQLSSLKGTANFEVKDGQLGSLGKFETYLRAANIMSLQIVRSSINLIISTLLPYNSGQISYATGNLSFDNGYIYFSPVKSSGKEMSLFITGKMNMLNYTGDMKILGRLSDNVIEVLGVLGNLSVEKILHHIPVFGKVTVGFLNMFNTSLVQSEINNVPKLTPNDASKTFQVILKGNLLSPSGVKSFHWVTTEDKLNATEEELRKQSSLAKTKEELIKEVQSGVETTKQQIMNEAQKLKEHNMKEMQQKTTETTKDISDKINNNQTFKNIKTFGDYIQKKVEEQKATKE